MAPVCPRVIFLIDKYQSSQIENLLTHLHLSCLRILSYYAHNSFSQESKNGVLWGYKFFNSQQKEIKFGCKQYPFLDFTIQHFDAFEKDLYNTFRDTTQKKDFRKGKFTANLKQSLTDLLSDFHWERPELFSPSKRRGLSIKVENDENNLVFMFCPGPICDGELGKYFGTAQTCNEVIETFLPKSLHSKFVNEFKIKIIWINTSKTPAEEMVTSHLLKFIVILLLLNVLSLCIQYI